MRLDGQSIIALAELPVYGLSRMENRPLIGGLSSG